jgi:hypothetical protein
VSEPTIFVVGAVAAVVAVATLRARRVRTAARVTVLVGCGLLLVSLVVGLLLLPERDAPAPLPGAIGILPPPPVLPHAGRGFALALATQVDGCANPVAVRMVTAGTSEYWSDYLAATRSSTRGAFPFVLVLPGEVMGNLRVGLASRATNITDPVDAQFGHASEIQIERTQRDIGRTIVTGRVTDWPSTLLPLVVTFNANWLSPRGLSTCYLRLPRLSGAQTATSVVDAVGGCSQINADYRNRPCKPLVTSGATPYVGALVVSHGTSIVTVRSGEVSPDMSAPPPSSVVDGNATWTCTATPDTIGRFSDRPGASVPDVVGGRGGGAAYSLRAIEGTAGGTCRAVAVITEDSAAYSRDLLILVIGAVMGLGLTLVVQAITEMLASRGSRHRQAPHTRAPASATPATDRADKPASRTDETAPPSGRTAPPTPRERQTPKHPQTKNPP